MPVVKGAPLIKYRDSMTNSNVVLIILGKKQEGEYFENISKR